MTYHIWRSSPDATARWTILSAAVCSDRMGPHRNHLSFQVFRVEWRPSCQHFNLSPCHKSPLPDSSKHPFRGFAQLCDVVRMSGRLTHGAS